MNKKRLNMLFTDSEFTVIDSYIFESLKSSITTPVVFDFAYPDKEIHMTDALNRNIEDYR